MRFDIFTLFPEMFPPYLDESILKRAREAGLLDVRLHNIRDWTTDKHNTTDDEPYGGGGGMVMKPEPIFAAVEDVLGAPPACPVILLTPQGRLFSQKVAVELSITSTVEREVTNVGKCLAAGYDNVLVLFLEESHIQACRDCLLAELSEVEQGKVKVESINAFHLVI